jgi:hypothetical protein
MMKTRSAMDVRQSLLKSKSIPTKNDKGVEDNGAKMGSFWCTVIVWGYEDYTETT